MPTYHPDARRCWCGSWFTLDESARLRNFCGRCRKQLATGTLKLNRALSPEAVRVMSDELVKAGYREFTVVTRGEPAEPAVVRDYRPQVPRVTVTPLAEVPAKLNELDRLTRAAAASDDDPLYHSAWHTGPLPLSMAGVREHERWRQARRDFVATFSDHDKKAMLSHVTLENPPLASDIARMQGPVKPVKPAWPVDSWHRFAAASLLMLAGAVLLGLGFFVAGALVCAVSVVIGLKSEVRKL